jgi:hypothetical protein
MAPIVNEGWDAKYVPRPVKTYMAGQAPPVQLQYQTTLLVMASSVGSNGDGALHYLHNYRHKRFSGNWCLLYLWLPRRDGKGFYLAVKGIGRKNGNGNDYAQVI